MRSVWSLARLATRVSDSVMSYNNTPERRRFLPPWLVEESEALLHCEGRRGADAGLCLFRGRVDLRLKPCPATSSVLSLTIYDALS